ncbi:DUF1998 domain-containing protein [Bacillus sp. 1813sda1]|uniref:DUF1998 domain-containing protein n=1 Tax=Bacillus sp. 1813sda1 TaxID=2953807 RepID=UPI00209D4407|nr:DUF1998 domain-containing protein [Bacillus sp. 1813sda1]MCP1166751.1 DUF1998 domain-containing protein [Bacillus sp. 1813sda1]
MANIPIRRAQIISPFGPGSLSISHDGVTMLMGGLDKWYINPGTREKSKHVSEFEIEEPRLKKILDVQSLRLPPDYRAGYKTEEPAPNQDLYLPMVRFPTWNYCEYCKKMKQLTLIDKNTRRCDCDKKGRLIQVPFVTICKDGHLNDFPWREWVHESANPRCSGELKLVSVGGTTLSTMNVKCLTCGKHRSLMGVNAKEGEGMTVLSKRLDTKSGEPFLCDGSRPWFGPSDKKESCGFPIIAALKSSSNVYFPETLSAIYLPGKRSTDVEKILNVFDTPHGNRILSALSNIPDEEARLQSAKTLFTFDLDGYEDSSIMQALRISLSSGGDDEEDINFDGIEKSIRLEEHVALIHPKDTDELKVISEWKQLDKDENILAKYINSINLITKLRETKVLYGFSRFETNNTGLTKESIRQGRELLFNNPDCSGNSWLPVNTVFGEGIFIELDHDLLNQWEESNDLMNARFHKLEARYNYLVNQKAIKEIGISPRYILVHTLAHMLINELVFECGYSAASLRERIYVNTDGNYKMNGFMIYTSSGDSEGTMGGLVRMGKKDSIFSLLDRAIRKSSWCSSDPVCSDIGKTSGQGYHHMNLSACHNCSYLPETSCEEFNMILDRAMITGTPEQPGIGFFDYISKQ